VEAEVEVRAVHGALAAADADGLSASPSPLTATSETGIPGEKIAL
jgi:hypothetical protein